MEDFDPITPTVRRALATSKVLLAFFSKSYPHRRACQQELTVAWMAALRIGDRPYNRVLVADPQPDRSHIPGMLCDQQQHLGWAGDPVKVSALGRRLAERGQPCLWIVDDLPSGLDQNATERWLAPWPDAGRWRAKSPTGSI